MEFSFNSFVETDTTSYKIWLWWSYIPNMKGTGLLVSDKRIFKSFANAKIFDLSVKKGKVNPKLSLFQTLLGPCTQCHIPSPRPIGSLVPSGGFLKGFYHSWVWRLSWSCDPNAARTLSSPQSNEPPCEIWLWLAQWFLMRRHLKHFPYMSLWKTSEPWGGAIFYPRALIWIILVEVLKK